ncbi:hypothetical protein IL306_008378 [Fusarium sp. DS 682]|nr:hypothetical protein IL306_008378 [Fusarium sp. DS 682]
MPPQPVPVDLTKKRHFYFSGASPQHTFYLVARPGGQEWSTIETAKGILWVPGCGFGRLSSLAASNQPDHEDHEDHSTIDVLSLSGSDDNNADIDRGLLPDTREYADPLLPQSVIGQLADGLYGEFEASYQKPNWKGVNQDLLDTEVEEARRGVSPESDSSGPSRASEPPTSSVRGVECFPIPELEIKGPAFAKAYEDSLSAYLRKHPQYYYLEPCESAQASSIPDNTTFDRTTVSPVTQSPITDTPLELPTTNQDSARITQSSETPTRDNFHSSSYTETGQSLETGESSTSRVCIPSRTTNMSSQSSKKSHQPGVEVLAMGVPVLSTFAEPVTRIQGPNGEYLETIESDSLREEGYTTLEIAEEYRWLEKAWGLSEDSRHKYSAYNNTNHLPGDNDRNARGTSVLDVVGCLDYQRQTIKVEVIGHEINQLWAPHPLEMSGHIQDESVVDGYRKPAEPIAIFNILPRACLATGCATKDAERRKSIIRSLGLSKDGQNDESIPGVVVGRSAVDLQPVMLIKSDTASMQTDISRDNMESVQLKTVVMRRPCGAEIIWTENVMIPGNLEFIKKGLWNKLEEGEKIHFLKHTRREHAALLHHGTTLTFGNALPSAKDHRRKPCFREIHTGLEYSKLHYRLRWPPMSVLKFPEEMIQAVKKFLFQYPHDAIPLNLALAAIVIYFDMEKSIGQNEGFSGNNIERVQEVPLGVFVCYFPHMLKFVELNHFTAFINPLRFALINYQQEVAVNPKFRIDSTHIHSLRMRQLYAEIGTICPEIPSTYRVDLIPASMPGTEMVFPKKAPRGEKPTINNFSFCLLNDIRTLGLPAYHYDPNAKPLKYMKLGGPLWLFPETLGNPVGALTGIPNTNYWVPETNVPQVALTGRACKVGPVFKDVNHISRSSVIDSNGNEFSRYCRDIGLETWVPFEKRDELSKKGNELCRVAIHMGVSLDGISICPNTLTPTWEGKDEHLMKLQADGELKRVAAESLENAPAAKRTKLPDESPGNQAEIPPEPMLNGSTRIEIIQPINSLKHKSQEWDNLLDCCQQGEGEDLTLKDIQFQIENIGSFISDVDHAFNGNDTSNKLTEVVNVMVRAAGHWNPKQRYDEAGWNYLLDAFQKRFGNEMMRDMTICQILQGNPGGVQTASKVLERLQKSDLIKQQRQVYTQLVELMKGGSQEG